MIRKHEISSNKKVNIKKKMQDFNWSKYKQAQSTSKNGISTVGYASACSFLHTCTLCVSKLPPFLLLHTTMETFLSSSKVFTFKVGTVWVLHTMPSFTLFFWWKYQMNFSVQHRFSGWLLVLVRKYEIWQFLDFWDDEHDSQLTGGLTVDHYIVTREIIQRCSQQWKK